MRAADRIVDFGPGPGIKGGKVVAAGSLQEIEGNPKSVTGQFSPELAVLRRIGNLGMRRRPKSWKSAEHDTTI